ncbi:MAG: HDOD domain-containing protein [Pirellulales bacterium]
MATSTITDPATLIELNRILASGHLPALPQSAIRLLELAKDAKNGPGEFAQPIEADPGLMGQVLKFVNSSYFGFSREISSVKHATTMVGIRTVKNFVLWSAVFSLMPNPKCGVFNLSNLWQDSLRRALFVRLFCKLMGQRDAEDAFVGALLQDMALPLLVKEYGDRYQKLFAQRNQGAVRLSDLEQAEFGWTHAAVGGMMARKWNLPESAAQLIERHVDPDILAAGQGSSPAELAVSLSALFPAVNDGSWVDCRLFSDWFQHLCPSGSSGVCEVLSQVDHEFMEFAPVLKVAAPPKTLVESHREALGLLA